MELKGCIGEGYFGRKWRFGIDFWRFGKGRIGGRIRWRSGKEGDGFGCYGEGGDEGLDLGC